MCIPTNCCLSADHLGTQNTRDQNVPSLVSMIAVVSTSENQMKAQVVSHSTSMIVLHPTIDAKKWISVLGFIKLFWTYYSTDRGQLCYPDSTSGILPMYPNKPALAEAILTMILAQALYIYIYIYACISIHVYTVYACTYRERERQRHSYTYTESYTLWNSTPRNTQPASTYCRTKPSQCSPTFCAQQGSLCGQPRLFLCQKSDAQNIQKTSWCKPPILELWGSCVVWQRYAVPILHAEQQLSP